MATAFSARGRDKPSALLDPAVRRRFHVVLDLPLPGEPERQQILERAAGQFGAALPQGLLAACGTALDGWTGSDLEAAMRAAVRKHLVGANGDQSRTSDDLVQFLPDKWLAAHPAARRTWSR